MAVTTAFLSRSTFKKGFKAGTITSYKNFCKDKHHWCRFRFVPSIKQLRDQTLVVLMPFKETHTHTPKINEAYSWLQYNTNKIGVHC